MNVLLVVLLLLSSEPGMVVRYYSGFAGKNLPLQLKGEMSKEEAARAVASVYEGTFDSGGRLVHVRKRLPNGTVQYEHTYEYGKDGSVRKAVEVESGVTVVWRLNSSGVLERDPVPPVPGK